MGNGNHPDPPYTSRYYPQLTDKQVEEFRGLLDRGLKKSARSPETLDSVYDEKRRVILGCSDQNTLNDLVNTVNELKQLPPNGDLPNRPTIVFDRGTLRRLIIVGGSVAMFHNRTPCLLRLASLLDRCLSRDLFNKFPKEFFYIVEALIDIGDEIIRRTKKPYKFFADTEANPPLDPKVLQIEPISNYHYWKTLLDVRTRKAWIQDPIPLEEAHWKVDDNAEWQLTLDEIERNLEATRVKGVISAAAVGLTPEISKRLENLRQLKFTDIERQSRARFPWSWSDDNVLQHVEVIIYNSVYSVLLNQRGEPLFVPFAPYAILIPKPGDNLIRNFHQPGLYLSVGTMADYQFWVSGKRVKNLLFAGITSFSRTQSTFKFEHYLQTKLQDYIKNQGIHAIAAITVPEAFGSGDLNISAVRRTMPGLMDEITRYAMIELAKRLGKLLDNYEQILKDVGEQVIREIIEDKVKDWCKEWLIKKIGKKFIPGVNVVSAFADVLDDEQTEMIRSMLACVIMATKSKRPDDMAVSAKILAKVSLDKVQEAVIKELVKRGGRLKLPGKGAKKGQDATDDPNAYDPKAPAPDKPADTDVAQTAKPTQTPDTPSTTGQTQNKPVTQQQLADQLRLAQQVQHGLQQSQQQPKADPKAQTASDEKPDAKAEAKPDAKPDTKPSPKPDTKPQQPAQHQRWQHQQLQQQQTKRPDPAVNDKATDANAVQNKGIDPTADKPGTAKPKRPDTPTRHEDAPDAKATDAKNTDAKVASGDGADARATPKDKGDRATKPRAPTPPKEPPLPPTNMPWRDRWKFYDKHKDEYPPHIRDMINNTEKRTKERHEQIDREIRDHHALELSHHWGIPITKTSRIPMKSAEKPPLPPKNMSWQKKWEFYDEHKDDYPPHIRDMLGNMKNRNEEQAKQVELAIKEHHANQPKQETSGGDWEKTNIAERTGQRPNLSATSTTKNGAEVQIDDFDPARRVAREYKASLEIAGQDPQVADRILKERMERHAEFAEDRGLAGYEWVAHSKDSHAKMTKALEELREAAQNTRDPELREKLKNRYKKITIAEEPILDE